jgi:ABC-type branched-subunit amino acid transport system ATPase component
VGTTARLAGRTTCTNCTHGLTTTRTAATTCNGKQMSGYSQGLNCTLGQGTAAAAAVRCSSSCALVNLCLADQQLDVEQHCVT